MMSLYLLQFACLIFTAMLALMLFTSRFHVDVVNAAYERSRWTLFAGMSLLVLHYVLQMVCGFRAESDDAGTIVNILFYTPVTFLIAHSILNIECNPQRRWQYDVAFIVIFVSILVVFIVGLLSRETSFYTRTKWIMHVLYLLAMASSIAVPMIEIHRNRGRVAIEGALRQKREPTSHHTSVILGQAIRCSALRPPLRSLRLSIVPCYSCLLP